MNKIMRVVVAVAIVPAFIFMASAACCPLQAQASNLRVATSQTVLKASPHACCPDGKPCANKSVFISKDEAVQSQDFQVNGSNLQTSVVHMATEVQLPQSNSRTFFGPVPFLKSDQISLSSIQLLI